MGIRDDLRRLLNWIEGHPEAEGPPIVTYATGDFTEGEPVNMAQSLARYLVLINTYEGSVVSFTLTPRAPGQEPIPFPLWSGAIISIPCAPWETITPPGAENVYYFFADEPVVIGSAGNVGGAA